VKKTAGKAWGDMPKVELTEEVKADIKSSVTEKLYLPKSFL
jgi:hypothetical protein